MTKNLLKYKKFHAAQLHRIRFEKQKKRTFYNKTKAKNTPETTVEKK